MGCCGFPISKRKYYSTFDLVEVQETFYNLPRLEKMRKWRMEAPQTFKFTMKAWQVITHPKTSPTWRKLRTEVEGKPENYGLLKPTKENLDAWAKTLEVAEALNCEVIVLQLPPKLELNERTYPKISAFLSSIDKGDHLLAIEPRNKTWHSNREGVKRLFEKFDVIHCVDIFKRDPVETGRAFYIRLHGLGGEINYSYKYTDNNLKTLKGKVKSLEEKEKDVYILFNNVYMLNDASRFLSMLRENYPK